MTDPKHDLLVFTKKEIFIVLTLLVLVALCSFTIGLKLGRGLSPHASDANHHDSAAGHEAAPLHEAGGHDDKNANKHADKHADDHAVAQGGGHAHDGHASNHAATAKNDSHAATAAPAAESGHAPAHAPAETVAIPSNVDSAVTGQLADEVKKEGLHLDKPIVTTLPTEKKAAVKKSTKSGFTLQVGAYRSEAEAQERVETLRRQNFSEAFHFQAEVPGKGVWYRVGIGLFPTRVEAEQKGRALSSQGGEVPTFIVQRVE